MPNPENPTWRGIGKGVLYGTIPELGFSVLGAATLPEGTPWQQRVGSAVENTLIDSAIGMVGEGGVGLGARRLGIKPETARIAQMGAMPLLYAGSNQFVPRPFTASAWDADQQKQLTLEMERRRQEDEQLASAVRDSTVSELLGPVERAQAYLGWGP
jgi:hypothetical protein